MSSDPNNQSTSTNPVGRFMVAVGGVIELGNTGKILVTQRSSELDWQAEKWGLMYGRIDQFEDAVTGLRREVYEESGITDLEVGEVLRVWHIFRGSEKAENELIGITFHCKTQQETVFISEEHAQYKWMRPEEALSVIEVEGIREDIQLFIKKRQSLK
jgi:8-oxo-dGTP diphosphatase